MGHYSNNNLIYSVDRTRVIVKNHFSDISLYMNNSLSVSPFLISRRFGNRCTEEDNYVCFLKEPCLASVT